MEIFDRLAERSADGELQPSLAVSWRSTDDTTREFKLRSGVKWHDGVDFTSDDVLFSLTRAVDVPNSPGGFGGFLRSVAEARAVDVTTVVIKTKTPSPSLPGDLANIAIVSRHAGEGATTGRLQFRKGNNRYRGQFRQGDRVILKKNADWWKKPVAWDHAVYRMIPNPGGRTAAFLSGDVEMIDTPAATDLRRLKSAPKISVAAVQGLRTIYLLPSFRLTQTTFIEKKRRGGAREESAVGFEGSTSVVTRDQPGGDRRSHHGRYRRRQRAMASRGILLIRSRPRRFQARSRSAKELLARAGYPDGFQVTLHVPNDRYPNAPAVAQAIAQMWTRIGIKTSVESLPSNTYFAMRNQFANSFWGLGNATYDASSMLFNVVGTRDPERRLGALNCGQL